MRRTGYSFIRYTFCTLNVVIWLAGCAILGVGIWLYLAYGGYATLLPSYSALSADSLCIAAGVVTFVIAFLGCCGSWFQNKCLLITYFLLVAVMFALEFTAGTLAFLYKEGVSDALKEELKTGIRLYYLADGEQGFTESWDRFQKLHFCCGVMAPSDWYAVAAWPNQEWVPDSCCKHDLRNATNCGKLNDLSIVNEKGCYERLHLWLIERMHWIGITILCFTFIQLFGLTASLLLCCTLRHRRYRKS